ncbi:MAG: hypothetical protein SCM96_13520 [Acidobacteriota bacterium]|nr:hypothetical protein [Acidobacteriota bacterium]
MNTNAPANLKKISALLRQGEGPALEFKRSTVVVTFKVRAGSTARVEISFECTILEKPNSRLRKYRLTLAGERALKERFGEER